jgi:hypothetical protein
MVHSIYLITDNGPQILKFQKQKYAKITSVKYLPKV